MIAGIDTQQGKLPSKNTNVGGVPAKTTRKRFSNDTIAALLQINWWDWPEEKIKQHISDIQTGRIDRLQPLCKGESHDGL